MLHRNTHTQKECIFHVLYLNFNPIATFQKRKALETTIYVVLTIVTLCIIATIIAVQKYAGSVIIKSASYLFCNLILFFNILMAVGSILYVISPEKGISMIFFLGGERKTRAMVL